MTRAGKKRVVPAGLALAIAGVTALAMLIPVRGLQAARARDQDPPPPTGMEYIVAWVDGSQAMGEEIADWIRTEDRPTLRGRALFDAENPVRTILDTRLSCGPAEDYVEFAGGDQLPGRVVGYHDGEQEGEPLGAPRLLVESPLNLDLPNLAGRSCIPVSLEMVRRVVRGAGKLKPVEKNTLRHVDGRHVAFRAARWKADSFELLVDSGILRVGFDEIADLALPGADENEAFLRELTILSPRLDSRLMQAEVVGGLRLTTSLERLRPYISPHGEYRARKEGKKQKPVHGLHIVQPAWALEPLGINPNLFCSRVFYSPQEVLLSRLRPVASRHYGAFSAAWTTFRRDRNVEGGPLLVAGNRSLWGIGVHAGHELQYELPAGATWFQASFGLDGAAGAGGSVIGRVLVDGKAVFESPLVMGSKPATPVGPITLDPGARTRLTLVADPAYGAPTSADPLDLRDIADWLDPIVRLDRATLADQAAQMTLRATPNLAGWTAAPATGAAWRLKNAWDPWKRSAPSFRNLMEITAPVTFTSTRRVAKPRDVLALWIGAFDRSVRPLVEISIAGHSQFVEHVSYVGYQGDVRPILVPLAQYAGQNVEISVRIEPPGTPALIDWRGMNWVEPTSDVDPNSL